MKKLMKWTAIVLPVLLLAGITFIVVGSYVEHQRLVEEEKAAYPAPGTLVDVDDGRRQMHVYAEGSGNATLVFMAGFGTSAPFYDFKALYERLSDDYRIAMVERAGYGWSDVSSSDRDIDTVLEETREALRGAGETPPYVLFPHSMAGLEAIHWAALYPDEVSTIIGLEPLVPDYYLQTEEDPPLSRVLTFLARSGLMRNQPDVCRDNVPAIQAGHLSDEETEIACTLFFRRTFTRDMWEEADALSENVTRVSEQEMPDIPFHAFISGQEGELWVDVLTEYTGEHGGEAFVLDAGHYLHVDEPERIARESKRLIEASRDGSQD